MCWSIRHLIIRRQFLSRYMNFLWDAFWWPFHASSSSLCWNATHFVCWNLRTRIEEINFHAANKQKRLKTEEKFSLAKNWFWFFPIFIFFLFSTQRVNQLKKQSNKENQTRMWNYEEFFLVRIDFHSLNDGRVGKFSLWIRHIFFCLRYLRQ